MCFVPAFTQFFGCFDRSPAKKERNCKNVNCSKAEEFPLLNKNQRKLLFVPLLSRLYRCINLLI
jgi:hypothetical protein